MTDELDMDDMFDFKFMVTINKTKTFRPLADDEILMNLFGSGGIIDKLIGEKKEIHYRKYIFLDVDNELS